MVGLHTLLHLGLSEERAAFERFETILDYNGIDHVRLNADAPDFWERVHDLDLFIFPRIGTSRHREFATTVMGIVENVLHIPCHPDARSSWHYDDKIREFYLLAMHHFPAIPTWVFWEKSHALDWAETCELPFVFKLKSGASSENVVLVRTRREAMRLIARMFSSGIVTGHIPGKANVRWKDRSVARILGHEVRRAIRRVRSDDADPYREIHKNYFLAQRFLAGNSFDTRVTVIGKRAFVSRRFVREGDFRASGGNIADWDRGAMDPRCVRIAQEISERLGFQVMCYDFLYDNGETPLISEFSYTCPDWTVWTCPGYWDEDLAWHDGHIWPQYALLSDLLHDPGLRQPEMTP